MIRVLCVCALAASCTSMAAELNVPDPIPYASHELTGTIGKHAIRMQLNQSTLYRCSDGVLQGYDIGVCYSGWYEYTKVGKRIKVRGCYNAQGIGGAAEHPPVEIDEYVDGKTTGMFLTTQDDIYSGRWSSGDVRSKKLPYSLHIVRDLPLAQRKADDEVDSRICPHDPDAQTSH